MADFGDPRLPKRFWSKVVPDPSTGCWLWSAAKSRKGYALFKHEFSTIGHRVAYFALVGVIPDETPDLDHLCRVHNCVNPEHLEPVTNAENQRRGRVNQNKPKTHCMNGHELSGDNLYTYTAPTRNHAEYRRCKTCAAVIKRRYIERQQFKQKTQSLRSAA